MIVALEKGMWETAELLLKYGAIMPNVKIKTLTQKINRIKEEYADLPPMILPPADDEEIKRHSRMLTGYGFPPIPHGYAEFLKVCDGYAFDGVELYGTESVTEEGSTFILHDIGSMTFKMNKRYEEYCEQSNKSLLWLGSDAGGNYYTYDDKTGKYQLRSHESIGEVYFEYGTFEELFDRLIYENQITDDEDNIKYIYKEGATVSETYDKIKTDDAVAKDALEYYRALAEKGNRSAQFELAAMLFLDSRFEDKEQAKEWLKRAAKLGHKQAKNALQNIKDYENMPKGRHRPEVAPPVGYTIDPGFDQKFEDDFRELFTSRLKEDEDFGCELWSALANVSWIHEDDPEETHCGRGFRSAGAMIASMLGIGDYIDWYCSGPYETVSEYIAEKMASKGWRYKLDGDGSDINTGRLTFKDGSLYEGEIENGKPNGKGKYTFISGDFSQRYEGDFVDGKFHGKGKFTMSDDHEYEGDFVEGAFQGKGKWINLRYDDIYEGDFFKGRRHGKGKIIYADGRVYEGEWAKGSWNGHGKMIYADGRIEEGEWKDGNFVGRNI